MDTYALCKLWLITLSRVEWQIWMKVVRIQSAIQSAIPSSSLLT
jgi:hypothetical protein